MSAIPMNAARYCVLGLLLIAAWPSDAGLVMTDVKWLLWPLILVLFAALPDRTRNPHWRYVQTAGIAWAILNQILLSGHGLLAGSGLSGIYILSPVSVSVIAALLAAPILGHMLPQVVHSDRIRMVAVSVLASVSILAAILQAGGVLKSMDTWGQALGSAPFGFKTELAGLLLLLLAPPWTQDGRQTSFGFSKEAMISFVLAAVVIAGIDSRAGMIGMLVLVTMHAYTGWRRHPALTFSVALLLAPLVILVGGLLLGDAALQTRVWLWWGALRSFAWLAPYESGAAFAMGSVSLALDPLLIKAAHSRFPLHLHNDILAIMLAGGWVLVLFFAMKRKLLPWTSAAPYVWFSLLPLLVSDSLIMRPVGLGILAAAVGLSLPLSTVVPPQGKLRIAVIPLAVLWLWGLLLPFNPSLCRQAPFYTSSGSRACATTMQAGDRGWTRLVSWVAVTRNGVPSSEVVRLKYYAATKDLKSYQRLEADLVKSWPSLRRKAGK